MRSFLATLTLLTLAVPARTAPATPLAEVTVTGEQPIALTGEVERTLSATNDTARLLLQVPGVYLVGAGGASSLPTIHGLADDRLRIKVDGMDLVASCPNHMNPPLSYLDPSQVATIKVYTTITPVSVGGDSLGGAIVAETTPPLFAAAEKPLLLAGQIGSYYRSNNDAMGGFLNARIASQQLSLGYAGAYGKAENYKAAKAFKPFTATGRPGHTLGREEVGSTAYETQTHTLGIGFQRDVHLLEAKLGYQKVPNQLYPNQRMDLLDNEQKRIALRYLGQFGWGDFEARAYHERVDHYMDFGNDKRFWYGMASGGPMAVNGVPHGSIGMNLAAGMPMYTESKNSGFSLRGNIELEDEQLLRLGAEFQQYRLDDWWPASGSMMWPGTFWNIKDGERDRNGLFAEWQAQLTPEWMTLLGVRYERVNMDAGDVRGYSTSGMAMGNQIAEATAFNTRDHSRHDDNLDLAAIARRTINEQLDLELGYAHKVRSPNLYERYTWSSWSMAAVMNNLVGDGNGYVGDIGLDPEQAHTLSATLDWHSPNREWQLKTTPFYSYVNDYIDAVRITNFPGSFNVLQYKNQDAELYGVDLWGRLPLGKNAFGAFGLEGLLAYVHGENRDTGEGLYNIMPLNAKVTLTHKTSAWENGLELLMVDSKDHISELRNEVKTPGYGLLNLRLSYGWRKARVDFGIENLLDKFYYLPLGGAYLGQGTTMSMTSGAPWGIGVPGMGRSLYLALKLEF